MRSNVSMSRATIAGAVLVALVATSGCSWFRKTNELYAQAPENRPLEVPPDLDAPRTDAAMGVPSGPVTASGTLAGAAASQGAAPAPLVGAAGDQASATAPASSGTGFTIATGGDEAFAQVEAALMRVEGVTIASRAKLLGAFDVNYRDSNFLVRVSQAQGGSYVSAVDPRGVPATGEAPAQLIAALRSALGGN